MEHVTARVERFVEVSEGCRLWAEARGDPTSPPVLLIMGANASGVAWPDAFVEHLAEKHFVVRYDHRDTGRSTHAFDEHPYPLTVLADDAIAVLDALDLDVVHAVGMSLGGTLLQVLLVDHPERFLSATIIGAAALDDADAPGPTARLLELWAELGDERSEEEERRWTIEHWRVLAGPALPFDPAEFERLDARISAHRGTPASATAHARADQSGLERNTRDITVPVLVIDAPEDPTAPPPTAERLASRIPHARRLVIPGMGHALPSAVVGPLAEAITIHVSQH